MSVVALCSMPIILCVYIAAPFLMKRFDKIVLYRACAILSMAMNLITWAIGYQNKAIVIVCMAIIAALAILPAIMMGVLPQDCIEYGTFKTGIRKEGITFALQSFVAKLTAAFASAFTGIMLHLIAYDGSAAVQAPETVSNIWNCSFLIPLSGQLLAIGFLFAYHLKDQDVQLMSDANSGRITREEAQQRMSRQYR